MKPGVAYLLIARDDVDAQKAEHDDGHGHGQILAVAATLDTDPDDLVAIALVHGEQALATVDPDATPSDVEQAFGATWLDGLAVGAAYMRSVLS